MKIKNATSCNKTVFAWDVDQGIAYQYHKELPVNQAIELVKKVREKLEINTQYWIVPTEIVMLDSWQHARRPVQISLYFVPKNQKLPDPNNHAKIRGYHGGSILAHTKGNDGNIYILELYND